MGSKGLRLVALVTAANRDDGTHAPTVLALLTAAHRRRLDEIRGDSKYNNRTRGRHLITSKARYTITVVERPPGVTGLVLLPDRWGGERTTAGTGACRRNREGDERTPASAAATTPVGMIHLMAHRLEPDPTAPKAEFRYPRAPRKQAADGPG